MTHSKYLKQYLFKIIWSKTDIGIAIDELQTGKHAIPLTTFYFWLREDGWNLLKFELDSKPWMNEKSKVAILNGYTILIQYWLKHSNKNFNLKNPCLDEISLNIKILALNSIN